MSKVELILSLVVLSGCSSAVQAQTPVPTPPPTKSIPQPEMPTWFLFGLREPNSSDDSPAEYMLYNGPRVIRRPDGHIEVWTKWVPLSEVKKAINVNSVVEKSIGAKVENLSMRMYDPPIVALNGWTDINTVTNVIFAEVSVSELMPPFRLMALWELDCEGRKQRSLNITMLKDGKQTSSDSVGEWKHIAPDTSMEALQNLLCRRQ